MFLLISLLLLLMLICVPAVSSAYSSPQIGLTLGKTTLSAGDSVTALCETAPNAWVPLKIIDGAGNILVFDAGKADANGHYSIDFIVPDSAAGALTVVAGEGCAVAAKNLAVEIKSSDSDGGSDSGGGPVSKPPQPPPEPVQEPEEPDLPPPPEEPADLKGHWAHDCIMSFLEQGVVAGYPDGSFRPDNKITRAEFATILTRAFKLKTHSDISFADTTGHWAQNFISAIVYHGLAAGLDAETFGPDDPLTREQMALMIIGAAQLTPAAGELSFTDSGSISVWAREAIATAVENGIMSGYPDNTFQPLESATRAEAMTVIMNALNILSQ